MRLASATKRRRSSVRFCSVMSRAMVEAPTQRPEESRFKELLHRIKALRTDASPGLTQ